MSMDGMGKIKTIGEARGGFFASPKLYVRI
jgi:hypothetical protein